MFSRRQTCRGRSQSPVVWIAEEMETDPSKPIDKASSGEVTSHWAVTKVNALWPRKAIFPRAEPTTIARISHTFGLVGGRCPKITPNINILREIGYDGGKNSLFF